MKSIIYAGYLVSANPSAYFTRQIRRNLHEILCLTSRHVPGAEFLMLSLIVINLVQDFRAFWEHRSCFLMFLLLIYFQVVNSGPHFIYSSGQLLRICSSFLFWLYVLLNRENSKMVSQKHVF